jgi:hypothetical protein
MKRRPVLIYAFSLVLALLVAVASVAGLLYPDRIYPGEALQQSFVANDVVNLLIVLPVLLGSMGFAWRGRLVGLLFWPGALFVVFYNAVAYTFGLPWGAGFLLALAQAPLSAYTTAALVATIDGEAVRERIGATAPARIPGGALVGAGLLFLLVAGSTLVGALAGGAPIADPALGVQVADLFIIPAWIIGGVLLWRREALGYVAGAGLLLQASVLFVGLLAFFALQPLLTGAPFALEDTVVVALMSLIVLVPFGLFLRGVGRRS